MRVHAGRRRLPREGSQLPMPSRPVVVLPAECTSPTQHLLPVVAYSMATIAPERVEDLKAVCDGLRFEFVDERRWRCSYRREDSTITMSTGVVELCWAASHPTSRFTIESSPTPRRAGRARSISRMTRS